MPAPGPASDHAGLLLSGDRVHRLTRDIEGEAHLVPDEVQPLDAHGQPYWPPGWGPDRCGLVQGSGFTIWGSEHVF